MTTTDSTLSYRIGDATAPYGSGPKFIAHVCNDAGGWGAGFVLALSARWAAPEAMYRSWHTSQKNFDLGMVQLVSVESDLWVANMVAQRSYRSKQNPVPLSYEALETCLAKLATRALDASASVHMPRIGAGLAGGDWTRIEDIVSATVVAAGVPVFVYDLS